MENNKIIAISGQPVTGKGTTVKSIISKLKEHGYSEMNIHVISTGHEFRNYFNAIFEFIKNYDQTEKLDELTQNEYLKIFVEKKEYREILIDTISQLKQSNIDIHKLNIEHANNLKEFSGLRKVIDGIIDKGVEEKGRDIDSEPRPNDIWLVDSRLAFHNIPQAFSVRLVSDPKVAAKRLLNDKSRGKEDSQYANLEEALAARENRRKGEQERYKKRYGVDLEDVDNYNLIIDTSYSTVEDTAETILTCLECHINNKPFAKNWASPKTLIPLQREQDTMGEGGSFYDLEELADKIKEEGYKPDKAIEVVEVDGVKYIIEGHHRNFAAALIKNTLVPYEVIAKDDEEVIYGGNARQRANGLQLRYLSGHEWMIGDDFSYNEVYPGLREKVKEREEAEGR